MLHLLAAGVVVGLAYWLVRRGRDWRERLALWVFVFASASLFALSGTYHLLEVGGAGRAVLQRLDHAAIWVMIAGSFTALHGVAFRGPWRWAFLAVVWAIAITGLTLKTIFFDSLPQIGGLVLYLVLGWLGVVSGVVLWRRDGWPAVRSLVWGGIAYSAGAAYDQAVGPSVVPGVVGAHELFHVAVVLGAALHWRAVLRLLPKVPS